MPLNRTDLADYSYFLAIARHRSFRRAGLELGVSASALSHALKGLETRVGIRLLNRTNRSVTLTAAGEELQAAICGPFDEIEQAVDRLNRYRDAPTGRIRINVASDAASTPARKIPRSKFEGARDMAREIMDLYGRASKRQRKKVEMLFAHLKRILKLDRLRLRGPNGARDEFHLAATAQNLRKMAKLVPMPAPAVALHLAHGSNAPGDDLGDVLVDRFVDGAAAVFPAPAAFGFRDAVPPEGSRATMPTSLVSADKSSAMRIDHVLLGPGVSALLGEEARHPAAEMASDHRPVWADILPAGGPAPAARHGRSRQGVQAREPHLRHPGGHARPLPGGVGGSATC